MLEDLTSEEILDTLLTVSTAWPEVETIFKDIYNEVINDKSGKPKVQVSAVPDPEVPRESTPAYVIALRFLDVWCLEQAAKNPGASLHTTANSYMDLTLRKSLALMYIKQREPPLRWTEWAAETVVEEVLAVPSHLEIVELRGETLTFEEIEKPSWQSCNGLSGRMVQRTSSERGQGLEWEFGS